MLNEIKCEKQIKYKYNLFLSSGNEIEVTSIFNPNALAKLVEQGNCLDLFVNNEKQRFNLKLVEKFVLLEEGEM